jgi:RnfABCDGE-type electron transport complex D subunit
MLMAETEPKPKPKKKPPIRWQKPMTGVLIALVPCLVASVYRFGWRSLAVVLACVISAYVAEFLFTRTRKEPVTSAVFVTAVILALTLPVTIPLWMAGVGAVIAIVFAKEAFGGFGRNVFNPAITGRCFLYICFPNVMSGSSVWLPAARGARGFLHWQVPAAADGVTQATPLAALREGAAELPGYWQLFVGDRGGCLGETMMLAILFGGAYLLYKKYADYRLVVASILGLLTTSAIMSLCEGWATPDPLWHLMAGGFLFGAVFMVTDPVSSARRPQAKWIYGLMVGALTIIFRRWGGFPEGMMFAILFMNIFNPTLDMLFPKKAKKSAAKPAPPREGAA